MKRSEFFKRIFIAYFVIVTCVTLIMGLMGLIFDPGRTFGYEAFFSPLIIGVISILPSFLIYSKKELSFRQTLIRKVMQFIFIVILLVLLNGFNSTWKWEIIFQYVTSIAIVYLMVQLIMWIIDCKKAEELSKDLKSFQKINR